MPRTSHILLSAAVLLLAQAASCLAQETPGTPESRLGPKNANMVDILLDQTEDESWRQDAAERMRYQPRRAYVEPLLKALAQDPAAKVRAAAAESLGLQKFDKDRIYQALVKAANEDKSADVQAKALQGLGWMEDKRALELLIAKSKSPHESVRLAVAFSLGRLKDPKGLPALVTLLTKDNAAKVRQEAAQQIAELPAPLGVPEMISALASEKDIETRWWIAFKLGQMQDKRALAPLIALTRSKEAKDRDIAAGALKWLALDEGMPAVIELLNDSDEKVRISAAECVGKRQVKAAVGPLLKGLNAAPQAVRLEMIKALGYISDPQAVMPLVERLARSVPHDAQTSELALHVPEGEVVTIRTALENIAQTDPTALKPGLIHMDARVRLLAAKAVGETKDRRGVESLLPLLKDPDPAVQLAVMECLTEMDDARAAIGIAQLLADGNSEVRNQAVRSLASLRCPDALPFLLAAMDRAAKDDRTLQVLDTVEVSLPFICPDAQAIEKKVSPLLAEGQPTDIRKTALGILCRLDDGRLLKYATAALKDADTQIRLAALRNLIGRLPRDRAQQYVLAALKDDDGRIRLTACEALIAAKDKRAFEPLISLLEVDDYRRDALEDLKVLADDRTNVKLLEQLNYLGDNLPEAALMLLPTGNPKVQQALAKWLQAEAAKPNAENLETLAQFGKASTPLLLKMLEDKAKDDANDHSGQDDEIKYSNIDISNIADALALTKDPAAIKPLLLLAAKTDPDEKSGQYQSLMAAAITLGHKPDVKPLLEMLKDEDRKVTAAVLLGKLRAPSAVDALIPMAMDGQMEAITALGEIGGEKAQQALLEVLRKRELWQAEHDVVPALVKMRTAKVKAELLKIARQKDPDPRFAAINILAKWRDPDAADVIAQGIIDREEISDTRLICEYLLEMNDPRAVGGLVNLMILRGRYDANGMILARLSKFGYKPANDRERVYWTIAAQQLDKLRTDPKAMGVLLKDAQDANASIAANAVEIMTTLLDEKQAVAALLELAKAKPMPMLIRAFAKSNSPALHQAAADWAIKNNKPVSERGEIGK